LPFIFDEVIEVFLEFKGIEMPPPFDPDVIWILPPFWTALIFELFWQKF
jgi:hypothetical protein